MFGNSRFNYNRYGFLYAPNPAPAPRAVGTPPPAPAEDAEVNLEEEDEEEDEEPEGLNESIKSYLSKQIAKATQDNATAIAKAKEDAKAEAKLELQKEQKAADRKAKLAKAKEEGNKDEEAETLRQELEELRKENEIIKATAGKETERAIKTRIAKEAGLPETFNVNRLLGASEAEWLADAKEMAKSLKVTAPKVDLEGGTAPKTTAEDQKKSSQKTAARILSAF